MESNNESLETRAATFLVKRGGGKWTQADQAELTAWLDAATANLVTFLRIEAAWEEMSRLKAIGAGLPRGKVPTPEELNTAHFNSTSETNPAAPVRLSPETPGIRDRRHAKARTIGMAAGLLLAIGIAAGSYETWFAGDRYTTPIGGIESIPLDDGSRITLNTDSRVRIRFTGQERTVYLARGEAFFTVAKDPNRPFIVHAGGTQVIALGTQFSVRRRGDDIQVIVTEGAVRLEREAASRVARPEKPAGAAHRVDDRTDVASAGAIGHIGAAGISIDRRPVATAEEILSWREGYVVFHETSLADAVAEFNRYNAHRIIIADSSVAAIPLTGKFRATNSEAFITLLQQAFHVHAQHTADAIVLTRQ